MGNALCGVGSTRPSQRPQFGNKYATNHGCYWPGSQQTETTDDDDNSNDDFQPSSTPFPMVSASPRFVPRSGPNATVAISGVSGFCKALHFGCPFRAFSASQPSLRLHSSRASSGCRLLSPVVQVCCCVQGFLVLNSAFGSPSAYPVNLSSCATYSALQSVRALMILSCILLSVAGCTSVVLLNHYGAADNLFKCCRWNSCVAKSGCFTLPSAYSALHAI
jgi:hypothetical protein